MHFLSVIDFMWHSVTNVHFSCVNVFILNTKSLKSTIMVLKKNWQGDKDIGIKLIQRSKDQGQIWVLVSLLKPEESLLITLTLHIQAAQS